MGVQIVADQIAVRDDSNRSSLSVEDFALFFATADLQHSTRLAYMRQLEDKVLSLTDSDIAIERMEELLRNRQIKNRTTLEKLLRREESQDIAFILWRESEFTPIESVRMAGMRKQGAPNRPITKNFISEIVANSRGLNDFKQSSSIARTVDRIFSAMEVFRLVEFDEENSRPNLRPIRATIRLHEFLTCAYAEISEIYASQIVRGG
jgi:hypothetical protein